MRGLRGRNGKLDLAGRSALVTGGARGIGYATARALAARGARVAILDLDAGAARAAAEGLQAEMAASPPTGDGRPVGDHAAAPAHAAPVAIGVGADVTDAGAMEAAAGEAARELGGLDVCVANAGIAPQGATVRAIDPAAFERVVEVNLLGVWRTVRAVLPHVTDAREGHLALVSSIYAFTNGACVAPYACAKAGVEQLGRALRVELAGHGVGVSVAYFGFVDTEMVRQGFDEDDLGKRMKAMAPSRLRKPISPDHAGESIAAGIERRAPRIIEPRQWRPLSVLRGIAGPLADRKMARHGGVQALVRQADVPGRRPGHELTDTATAPTKPS